LSRQRYQASEVHRSSPKFKGDAVNRLFFSMADFFTRGIPQCTAALALLLVLTPQVISTASAANGLLQAREGVSALLRGKYEKAIVAYSEALKDKTLSDPRRANIYNDRGVAKWRLKDAKAAVEDFNQAIALFPDYAVVYNNRGNALIDIGQPDEAVNDFDRAIALAPGYGAAYNNRGNANHVQGKFNAAARDFRKAAKLMPTNAVPYNGSGKTHVALGRPFAAIRDFNRAITLNAKYSSAHENRAEALTAVERHDDAVADFSDTLKVRPGDPALYLARGRIYAKSRKYNSAFRDFDRALKLAPDMAQAYLERARVHMTLKRYKPAQKDLSQAVALDSSLSPAFMLRAETYLRLGIAGEGLGDANVALVLKPGDAASLNIRAKIYEAVGRNEEAIADYKAVLALKPDHQDARAALQHFGEDTPAAPQVIKIGQPVKSWQIFRDAQGRYFTTNRRFPKMRVALEMYGTGEPKILAWNVLKNHLRGIGLLEYAAGTVDEDGGKKLEYVAIVDLWRSKVVSIEPDTWGNDRAKWDWKYASVVVTDPEGNANEIKLRKGAPSPYGFEAESRWFTDGYRQGRPQPRTYRQQRQQRRQSPGLLDWLFR